MNSNQLRIGNYFYPIDRGGEVHIPIQVPQEILGISLGEVNFINAGENPAQQEFLLNMPLRDVAPIPLNEYWVERCNIKIQGKTFWGIWFSNRDNERPFSLYKKDGEYYYIHGKWPVKIKYLHQLQNLYFAVVEEEVKINVA